jgi:hypothetical protein
MSAAGTSAAGNAAAEKSELGAPTDELSSKRESELLVLQSSLQSFLVFDLFIFSRWNSQPVVIPTLDAAFHLTNSSFAQTYGETRNREKQDSARRVAELSKNMVAASGTELRRSMKDSLHSS